MVASPWCQWVNYVECDLGVCFPDTFYSVDAQWITAKKDWEESKRRHKLQRQKGLAEPPSDGSEAGQTKNEAVYDKDMDASRCIIYLHGGENFLFVE